MHNSLHFVFISRYYSTSLNIYFAKLRNSRRFPERLEVQSFYYPLTFSSWKVFKFDYRKFLCHLLA